MRINMNEGNRGSQMKVIKVRKVYSFALCIPFLLALYVPVYANNGDSKEAFLGVETMLAGWRGGFAFDESFRIRFTTKIDEINQLAEIEGEWVREKHVELIQDHERIYERMAFSHSRFEHIETCTLRSFDGSISRFFLPGRGGGQGIIQPGLLKSYGESGRSNCKQYLWFPEMKLLVNSEDEHHQGLSRLEEYLLNEHASVDPVLEMVVGEMCHVVRIKDPQYPSEERVLWIAHQKGMYPVRYRQYQGGKLKNEIEVEALEKIGSNTGDIWYPSKIRRFCYVEGFVHLTERMEVAYYESDIVADDSIFQFQFPQGARVRDLIVGGEYTIGGDVANKNILLKEIDESMTLPGEVKDELEQGDIQDESYNETEESLQQVDMNNIQKNELDNDIARGISAMTDAKYNKRHVVVLLIVVVLISALVWWAYSRSKARLKGE